MPPTPPNDADESSILLRNQNGEKGSREPVTTAELDDEDKLLRKRGSRWVRWATSKKGVLCAALLGSLAVVGLALVVVRRRQGSATAVPPPPPKVQRIAFIGNSMFYFNDFPRFFQAFANSSGAYNVRQNSCLQGGGSIPSLWLEGNAMFPQFQTDKAIVQTATAQEQDYHGTSSSSKDPPVVYDYGACTVPQLLTGTDDRLDDPGYAVPLDTNATNLNPCRADPNYLTYTEETLPRSTPQHWDFVMINDNTRNPARLATRAHSLQFLESFYVPLLLQTKAVPVLLWTHAYSTEAQVNMTGLEDVANFTSLTLVGYKAYAHLLRQYLPAEQAPRIAPVGLAFLTVHEENIGVWRTLFHSDRLHASPSGSFLQALCVYHTLFGEMPDEQLVVRRNMASFWQNARMMQHAWEPPNPFPSRRRAAYLYGVARRVLVEGHVPASFIDYQNGESAAGWIKSKE